jgi:hypothetical protein
MTDKKLLTKLYESLYENEKKRIILGCYLYKTPRDEFKMTPKDREEIIVWIYQTCGELSSTRQTLNLSISIFDLFKYKYKNIKKNEWYLCALTCIFIASYFF